MTVDSGNGNYDYALGAVPAPERERGDHGDEKEGRRPEVLTPERRKPGRPRIHPPVSAPALAAASHEPRPIAAFRYKRVALAVVLQQAWQHDGGLEWRAVETVPEQAPDWEPQNAGG
jgi:hypothetical protein